MSEEVPVNRSDLVALLIVSVIGGVAVASWLLTPRLSPQYLNAVMVSSVMLAFFLFIPVMGIRLFVDDRQSRE
ncbi:hypothetical protein EA462_10175 [Natrarchaeobius halalkaliphilus]|uniref:Uncharacterized protein n=1 Tax=Natrarchaeobius halalkaliphilus TaxID=1679091 RepID=A0A3N6M504_9EURY|nr:hypothetical protein [Natrarchaeobius halalkaliphilus]RQG90331.1 hypothetical protein EA462_10175 [Natrarchaeobius halalkaliphilus]